MKWKKFSVPLPSSDVFKRRISVLQTENLHPWVELCNCISRLIAYKYFVPAIWLLLQESKQKFKRAVYGTVNTADIFRLGHILLLAPMRIIIFHMIKKFCNF